MVGESLQPDGMLALMKWDEETPYIYFFKHGLDEEKVVSVEYWIVCRHYYLFVHVSAFYRQDLPQAALPVLA